MVTGSTSRLPFFTLTLSTISILIFMIPAMNNALQWQRHDPAGLQFLQTFTSHFTHWNLNHLVWDITLFLTLGIIVELESPKKLLWTILLSTVSITLFMIFFQIDINQYRGLSGIDSALFACICSQYWLDKSNRYRFISIVFCLLFMLKTIVEVYSSSSIFVTQSNTFIPLPSAHIIGFIAGLLIPIFMNKQQV